MKLDLNGNYDYIKLLEVFRLVANQIENFNKPTLV